MTENRGGKDPGHEINSWWEAVVTQKIVEENYLQFRITLPEP